VRLHFYQALSLLFTSLACICVGDASASEPEMGRVAEYRLAPGTHAQSLVAGPDGNVWFAGLRYEAQSVTDVVGKVTPRGRVTEFSLGSHPENLGLSDITVGPDGKLWFTEGGRAKVGSISLAGLATEYNLPTPNASAASIVAGPDGNLWFTEAVVGKVGRITPEGAVSEFVLPLEGNGASGIAAGPDGALWVAEQAPSTIARIGTDGSGSVFPPAGMGFYPREIIVGPDGALWFSEVGKSEVGRLTTSGEARQFPAPAGRQTYAISTGPFGDLWHSNGGGQIGSISPAGATAGSACIRSCRLPITSLTEGPEGKLWFAAGTEPRAPFTAPGTVGTFAPPALQARIDPEFALRGHTLSLRVRCNGGAAGDICQGSLRVLGPTPSASGGTGATRLLASRELHQHLESERRYVLRLPGPTVRLLAERGRLRLTAKTTIKGGRRDIRGVPVEL
jgi:virginiamycin B lyase